MKNYDIAVIGAGIAGASVAAELAGAARVVLLEMEAQPGYHSTGRSAAVYEPSYGPPPIRALTRASGAFFRAPPPGFAEAPLLTPRETLFIARADQLATLDAMEGELAAQEDIQRLDAAQLIARHPLLRPGYAAAGLSSTTASDIDVAALLQGYLRLLGARGGVLMCNASVLSLRHDGAAWELETPAGRFAAARVVNAAGAWAEHVGGLAGAEAIGLVPKRRSVALVSAPDGTEVAALPAVVDADEDFYMKPDAGRLLISPANEDPEPPSDVQPDALDIAHAVDRVERAFTLEIRRIGHKWAGLRSFVADKAPVVGYSSRVPHFFWLAGQGGYGIQSAPALARLAAALVLGGDLPADILREGVNPEEIAPDRL